MDLSEMRIYSPANYMEPEIPFQGYYSGYRNIVSQVPH